MASQQSPTYTPSQISPPDDSVARQAAEAERQQAIEAQLRKDEAEAKAKQRQADFEKAKQDALSSMKGIMGAELDLKGLSTSDNLGLKGLGDASVVDLRHLDPDKPIVVDPNVVKGKPRRIPVQPGSCTPKGEDYEKGFGELKKGNPAVALEYFKKAEAENLDNPLVRNAIDLAKDLIKVREDIARSAEERERFTAARCAFLDGTDALRKGDIVAAGDLLHRAITTNLSDTNLWEATKATQTYLYWAKRGQPTATASTDEKTLFAGVAKHSAQALEYLITGQYKPAIEQLDAADVLFADQYFNDEFDYATGKPRPTFEASEPRAKMRSGLMDARKQAAKALEQSKP